MGKTDNIKRAKRMKEARRQRELEALIASGNGPATKKVKKRLDPESDKFIVKATKVKYSELFNSFTMPFVDPKDTFEIIKYKFNLAMLAWNTSIKSYGDEEVYSEIKSEIIEIMPAFKEIESVFDEMVAFKNEEFSQYKDQIVNFEMKQISGRDFELFVVRDPYVGPRSDLKT